MEHMEIRHIITCMWFLSIRMDMNGGGVFAMNPGVKTLSEEAYQEMGSII